MEWIEVKNCGMGFIEGSLFAKSIFSKIKKCQYLSYSWKQNSASVCEFISMVFNYTVTQYFP